MKQEEFLQLPLAQLIDIISSDVLDVSSEEQVYVAVMSWIKHNKDERRSHLKNILKQCNASSKFKESYQHIKNCCFERICS